MKDKRVWGALLFTVCIIGVVTFVALYLSSPAHEPAAAIIALVFFAVAIIAAVIQSLVSMYKEDKIADKVIRESRPYLLRRNDN